MYDAKPNMDELFNQTGSLFGWYRCLGEMCVSQETCIGTKLPVNWTFVNTLVLAELDVRFLRDNLNKTFGYKCRQNKDEVKTLDNLINLACNSFTKKLRRRRLRPRRRRRRRQSIKLLTNLNDHDSSCWRVITLRPNVTWYSDKLRNHVKVLSFMSLCWSDVVVHNLYK